MSCTAENLYMELRGVWRIKRMLAQINMRGIILMYHRIGNFDSDPWNLSVSTDKFEEQMQWLRKYYIPVSIQEMLRKIKYFPAGKKEIVVTFDDAYAANFHNAKPILERYGIPATFFVVSDAMSNKEEFWWDELARVILTIKTLPETFEMIISGVLYRWKIKLVSEQKIMGYAPCSYPNNTELSKEQLYFALWEIIGQLSHNEKRAYLKKISLWAAQISMPRTDYLPMNSQEIASLANSNLFEIGAHTVNHPMLTHLSTENQKNEILQSKITLKNITNRPVTGFCYPHGDFSLETIKILRELKFKYACTVTQKTVSINNDLFLLPRFMVFNWAAERFEKRLKEWFV